MHNKDLFDFLSNEGMLCILIRIASLSIEAILRSTHNIPLSI